MVKLICAECAGTGVAERIQGYDRPCDVCHGKGTRPQPSAEPVAVWREACKAEREAPYGTPHDDAANQAAASVIQAYGDARAEAARREALEWAAKVAMGTMIIQLSNAHRSWNAACRHIADDLQDCAALKENPNAG